MDTQQIGTFAVILIIAASVSWAFLLHRREWAKLSELAAKNGWTLRRGRGDTAAILTGMQDGIRWTMTYQDIYGASSTSDGTTEHVERFIEWHSGSPAAPNGRIVLAPIPFSSFKHLRDKTSPQGGPLERFAAQMLAAKLDIPAKSAQPLLIGSEAFKNKYTAFGSSPGAVRSVLIGAEGILAEWPADPMWIYMPRITVDSGGVTLRLTLRGTEFSPAVKVGSALLVERFVQLGIAIVKSIRNYS